MHHFRYQPTSKGEVLFAEDVNLRGLAESLETPFYCYSKATLSRHVLVFKEAFAKIPHLICYAVKANANLALLRFFAEQGLGFDLVSGGELFRVLQAGGSAEKCVFSGVGKTAREIEEAILNRVLLLNVESESELLLTNDIAKKMGRTVDIAIRVNPNIDPKTHPYIATGLNQSKFGLPEAAAMDLFETSKKLKNIVAKGVDCHIGSQLTELGPFEDTVDLLSDFILQLRKKGFPIEFLDLGGGLGIQYHHETPPHPRDYAAILIPKLKPLQVKLILEPGRVIVGNAGVLVTKVLYRKTQGKKNFVIVDAGMNDLIRPALYEAHHDILPVEQHHREREVVDVVGPVCESGDFFAQGRNLPITKPGECLSIMSAGAYAFAMASHYNARPKIPEVLVDGDTFEVIRHRENRFSLIRGEEDRLPFAKMHGLGNDFVVFDGRHLNHSELDWNRLSQQLCDRHFGIGADQLLMIRHARHPKKADFALDIFDQDGSQVEMCGNGLRAVAQFLYEEHIFLDACVRIQLPDRIVSVRHLPENLYCVDMGKPIVDGKKIPTKKSGRVVNFPLTFTASGKNHEVILTAVSMGNPHAVIFQQMDVRKFPVTEMGPGIEHHAFFPKRVNVEFVNLIGRKKVRCRVWERGTGETLACGSGACAIVVAGVLTKRTERQVEVVLPGGSLQVEWSKKDGHVYLTGSSTRVFEGDIDLRPFLKGAKK